MDDKFEVTVKTDSNDAKCPDTRSLMGSVMDLNGVLVTCRSSTQKTMILLTIKPELNAAIMGVQDHCS